MDGNGRWAQKRGLKRTEGHAAGEEALFDTVKGALDVGLSWLTVYAFSTENWRRPLDEVRFLMHFNESLLLRRRDELNDLGVRVRFIGRRSGRVQIVDAVKSIAEEVKQGRIDPSRVSERTISRHLYAPDMPDPDVLVRTSGEFRTSNYLLWQAAYSELVFTDVLWPDFRRADLFSAITEFQNRNRRFGGIGNPD